MDESLNGAVELAGWHAFVHQADGFGLCRIEYFRAQEIASGLTCADGGDHIRRNHRRHQSELDLAQAEFGAVGRHRDIAAAGQSDAAAVCRTVDAGYGGKGQIVQAPQAARQRHGIGEIVVFAGLGHGTHPVQIGACRECRASTGQDQGARLERLESGQCFIKIAYQFGIKGVVAGRAVERNRSEGAGERVKDRTCHDSAHLGGALS